jgi:hypothetical protein
MKVYLFHEETGLYEGETFEESGKLQSKNSITPIPPPDYGHGQVPVFDRRNGGWAVIPATIARQLLNISTSESTESKV